MSKEVPFRWLVIVRDNGRTSAQYELELPKDTDKDFVKTVSAFNEFKGLEIARSQLSQTYRRVTFTSWADAQEAKLVRPTCTKISTLWALFKAIEYDWKSKEYT